MFLYDDRIYSQKPGSKKKQNNDFKISIPKN